MEHDQAQSDDSRLSIEDLANAGNGASEPRVSEDVATTTGSEARHAAEPEAVAGAPRQTDDDEAAAQLFEPAVVQRFRLRWKEIQTQFVDDPREAVQGADRLVAQVMRSLASTFTDHKHELEDQWQQDSSPETEDLRIALRRYRSLFNQLLNS